MNKHTRLKVGILLNNGTVGIENEAGGMHFAVAATKENAQAIVTACNSHKELVEACKLALDSLKELATDSPFETDDTINRLLCRVIAKAEQQP